jgi:interferon gamma-inducible protein 30
MTCGLNHIEDDHTSFDFVECIFANDEDRVSTDYDLVLDKCAVQVKVAKDVHETIKKYYTSAFGNQLEHIMAVQTLELEPAHQGVPWIVANGEHTQEIQDFATDSLIGYVCETYQGDNKAAVCSQF